MAAISPAFADFLRKQQVLAALAVAVYLTLVAANTAPNAIVTIIYTFVLGNVVLLILDNLSFLFCDRPFPQNWIVFLSLLLLLTPPAVVGATAVVYFILQTPGVTFPQYLATGWRFPTLVTVLFAIVYNLYRFLERSNRELKRAVEFETAGREQQTQELLRAREIQQSLLPKQIPQVRGFEVVGAWEPARVVGGDYYDVIRLGDNKLAICIADVVGKGVSAALLMANVQATVRAYASDSASPAWLCSRVNSVLCANIASDKFVTLLFGVLDAERRSFHYTNAGHLEPILLRASGKVETLSNGGAVLGVFPEWKYSDEEVHLGAGDRLLLFTDGITEAESATGEEFGESRLVAAAMTAARSSASGLKDELLSSVNTFCNSRLNDDATLLVIAAAHAQSQIQK